jgi:hypothetical protein
MELLAEGLCEKLPDRGYRLVRRTRGDKKVILFGPVMEELGREMLIERPTIMPAILKAKNAGYHVLVAGFCNRKTIVILGGTGGFAPGWNGMNDLVAKENGIKPSTLVLVPGNVCNCENQAQKKMAMDMADMTAKVLWPSG